MEQFWGCIIQFLSSSEGYNSIFGVKCCVLGNIYHFSFQVLDKMIWNYTWYISTYIWGVIMSFMGDTEGYKIIISTFFTITNSKSLMLIQNDRHYFLCDKISILKRGFIICERYWGLQGLFWDQWRTITFWQYYLNTTKTIVTEIGRYYTISIIKY